MSNGAVTDELPAPPDPPYITIRKLREAKGWTQQTLAAHLKVDRSLIAHYENGKKRPSASTMQRIHGLTKFTAPNRAEIIVTKQELNGLLEALDKAGKDELDQGVALINYSYLRVLSTLILCATGAIETTISPRYIEVFFTHRKELLEEKRQRGLGGQRDVTPAQASAVDGQVYETQAVEPPTTTPCDGPNSDYVASEQPPLSTNESTTDK